MHTRFSSEHFNRGQAGEIAQGRFRISANTCYELSRPSWRVSPRRKLKIALSSVGSEERETETHQASSDAVPQVTPAGRREQHFSVHSSLLRYGCRLHVRQRDVAFLYKPSESATEPLHVSPFSFLDRDICRLDTDYGVPLAGGSAAGWIERA